MTAVFDHDALENFDALRELASGHGIATEFHDWLGQQRQIAPSTIIAVLAALGIAANTDAEVAASLQATEEKRWRQVLPPTIVLRVGWTPWVAVHLPHGRQAGLVLTLEDGSKRAVQQIDHWVDPRELDGTLIGEATFALPADLPLGWHLATATIDGRPSGEATVVVTPQSLELPPALTQPVWGLMEQVYQLRSHQSWGIGDLDDLARTTHWAAELGADFCLINPLHAAAPTSPMEPSPYLPTSRRFANPIYLSLRLIPGYDDLPDHLRQRPDFGGDTLDRDRVWAAKHVVLTELWERRRPDDEPAFREYCEQQGRALVDFATWCALTLDPSSRSDLPGPDSPEVAQDAETHRDQVDFHCWLQWQVDQQLHRAHAGALAAGMSLGLITDLAVGVHPGGADAWALQDSLAVGIHVGAPPDQFNQLGQDWHQPPWHPAKLAKQGYAPYRELIRSVLRHCGAIRIDHVIGLFRLWWIPEGMTPDQGTYLRYDHEALIGILLLEAQRSGVVVIGEDLGVVEPMARDHLAERGILGTSIMWFEWRDGSPLPPEDYRRLCLSTLTTHDLPPTAGYLDLIHVHIREELGLLTRSVAEEEAAEEEAIDKVRRALRDRGLLAPGADDVDSVVTALHAWLAQTPSLLRGIALADLAGDRRPINQPGTSTEYPNWSLPLAGPDGAEVLLEDLRDSHLVSGLVGTFPKKSANSRQN